ncbi:MAG: TfoX/Sxy family protein [Clostridia bacterium]
MASTEEYVQYVCEQMSGAGTITYKKMFGEYTIYCDKKVLGLICDNQVFIKPTAAADAMMPTAARMPPYEGAKPHIVLDDLDDTAFLTAFIFATCRELPLPKPKKKKAQ